MELLNPVVIQMKTTSYNNNGILVIGLSQMEFTY